MYRNRNITYLFVCLFFLSPVMLVPLKLYGMTDRMGNTFFFFFFGHHSFFSEQPENKNNLARIIRKRKKKKD